jgi:hypothetical protein
MLSEKLMKILTVPSNQLSLCFISLRFLTRYEMESFCLCNLG